MQKLYFRNQIDEKSHRHYTSRMNDFLIKDLKPSHILKTEEGNLMNGCLFCLGVSNLRSSVPEAHRAEWSPDGDYLAATSGNSIQIWDTDREQMVHEVNTHTGMFGKSSHSGS
jgi:WD40 repeat protein